ncbi:hypothetical protein [Lysinibacillus fusiformis]|uniref:Uncharacterized protein n=1 Tax=Lysinibacillus fusiformis TaxID=28031 RepID=A0A1H9N1C6_9BACI|nr:hypothetical protein [Lysinibacillus fusiformis]SCY64904.1 hypothetical protein SAMN02787081_03500 [Lysinibacillus fusiformis]SEO04378.1 hypothetical protein SAMN02787103_03303 [Lysinibacillus fusiformis]SER29631.1 hypothetical protein SAMN02787113_03459 [Lysinibacillus fusiformis]
MTKNQIHERQQLEMLTIDQFQSLISEKARGCYVILENYMWKRPNINAILSTPMK